MKKNFVKKTLASTLALAMVATAMPAAFTASAAKAPALNKKTKTLYINENEIGSSFDFNISNKVAKSTYKWSTSNKSVATVKSNGLTKAGTKTGKATISCKITLPTKKTKTLKATVTVKENATKVVVKNAPEKEIGIGATAYDFNSTMTSASGAKATDYRVWEIDAESNTAGATIDAKSGVVSTTKAGEFKVRVRAYQNKAKLAANDTVDSEWLTVKVVSSLVSVTQNSVTKLTATFDDNMKDVVKTSDFAIKNKATNVVSAVKGVSFSDDGKTVTVETYAQFADGATYVVTYGGKDYDVATTIGEVATVEVTTSTVVENKESEIKYVLKNANGVDITDAKSSTVTIDEVENKDGWLNDGKLTIFNKGSVAKVKVTYHTYKYATNGTEEGAITTEAVITAVDESAATVGNYKNYVITDKASVDFTKVTENNNVICVDETRNLFLKALNSDNKDVTGITFSSGNDDILLVRTDGDHAVLTAVKEGSTVVVVKNEKGTVLWTLPVVIKAARKANTISLASTTVTVSNSSELDTTKVAVKVKDQHGDDMDSSDKFEEPEAASNYATTAPIVYSDTDGNVVVNASGAKEGSYQYKVKLSAEKTKLVVLTVVVRNAKADKVSTIVFQNPSTSVETTIDSATTVADMKVSMKVVAKGTDGVDYKYQAATIKVDAPDGYKGAKEFTATNGAFDFVYASADSASPSAITKVPVGTYKFTAIYTTIENGKTVEKRNVTYVKVEDKQVAPTATVGKTSSDKNTIAEAISDCITVKKGDTEFAIESFDKVDNGSSVYVKSVTVYETVTVKDGTVRVAHTININRSISFKK